MNTAPTALAPLTVTVQPAVPVHTPVQPAKVLPLLALAVREIAVPAAYGDTHWLPQAMRLSAESTLPLPVPDLVMLMKSPCTFTAVMLALMKSPISPALATLHKMSAHSASLVTGSTNPL